MKHYGPRGEWIEERIGCLRVGLSKGVISCLLPVHWIELPEVGSILQEGDVACVLESSKAAIDVPSPISGKVLRRNDKLTLELLEKDPEGSGWLYEIRKP